MYPQVTGAELTTVYTTARKFRPGQKYYDESGQEYIFIKYDQGSGSVAGTQGLFVCQQTQTKARWECTADFDDAEAMPNCPVGQLQATLANAEYGFVMSKGRNRYAVTTDGSVTALHPVCLTTGNGTIKNDAGTEVTCGVSHVADTGTTIAVGYLEINCPV